MRLIFEYVCSVMWLTPESVSTSVSTHCCAAVAVVQRVSAVPSAFVPRYLRLAPPVSMVTYEPKFVIVQFCAVDAFQRMAEVPSRLGVRWERSTVAVLDRECRSVLVPLFAQQPSGATRGGEAAL